MCAISGVGVPPGRKEMEDILHDAVRQELRKHVNIESPQIKRISERTLKRTLEKCNITIASAWGQSKARKTMSISSTSQTLLSPDSMTT